MTFEEGKAFFAARKERERHGLPYMSIGQMRDALKIQGERI